MATTSAAAARNTRTLPMEPIGALDDATAARLDEDEAAGIALGHKGFGALYRSLRRLSIRVAALEASDEKFDQEARVNVDYKLEYMRAQVKQTQAHLWHLERLVQAACEENDTPGPEEKPF